MYAFVDAHRAAYGVEPICRVLQVAPSRYYEHRARAADPRRRPARPRHDETLRESVRRVWRDNRRVYGARKVWRWSSPRDWVTRGSRSDGGSGRP
jgi:hypothetical protein